MDLSRWRSLSIVLAVLAVLFIASRVRESTYRSSSAALLGLDEASVGRIVITEGDVLVELIRMDTLWVLAGHETDKLRSWRMDAIFASVLGVKRESAVSENPEKWTTYGVDSTGRQLLIYDLKGELQSHVIVGRSSANWQSSYVRRIDEDEVYMTNRSIYQYLSTASDFWLEPPPVVDTSAVEE